MPLFGELASDIETRLGRHNRVRASQQEQDWGLEPPSMGSGTRPEATIGVEEHNSPDALESVGGGFREIRWQGTRRVHREQVHDRPGSVRPADEHDAFRVDVRQSLHVVERHEHITRTF